MDSSVLRGVFRSKHGRPIRALNLLHWSRGYLKTGLKNCEKPVCAEAASDTPGDENPFARTGIDGAPSVNGSPPSGGWLRRPRSPLHKDAGEFSPPLFWPLPDSGIRSRRLVLQRLRLKRSRLRGFGDIGADDRESLLLQRCAVNSLLSSSGLGLCKQIAT